MMKTLESYRFTIIVPLYNEEDNIAVLVEKLSVYIRQASVTTCVLFVNDGSTDNSLPYIKEICRNRQDFYFISFQKNSGLSAALKAGIDFAASQYVGYIDADLQTAPEDFDRLLPYVKDYELVMGVRAERKDSFFKKIQSKIANGFRRAMTHDGITDTGCPLKVMHTDYARRIPFFTGMHRFLPALIQLQNGRVKEVPVRHFPRVAGVSKYHLWNRLFSPFVDCFAYRWMKKRYINYNISESNLSV